MSFAVAAPACSLRAAPRSPLRRRCVSRALRVRASVHEEEPREGLGRYLARAAASLFAPADDHGVRFPLVPYDGRPLRAADRKKLARFEQVVRTTRDTLDAMPHDAPAGSKQHQDIGALPSCAPLPAICVLMARCDAAQAIGWLRLLRRSSPSPKPTKRRSSRCAPSSVMS